MSVIPDDPMRSLSRWIRFHNDVDVGTCQNYDYEGRIQLTSDTQWENPGTASGCKCVKKQKIESSQTNEEFDLQYDNSCTCNVLSLETYARTQTVECSGIELQKNIVREPVWTHLVMSMTKQLISKSSLILLDR